MTGINRKRVLILLLAALATIGVILVLFHADSQVNDRNLEFLRSYGWEVEEEPVEIVRLTIPQEFDQVYQAYSRISQEGGLDLQEYRGVRATRYSYRVLNHRDSQTGLIRANVFVTKSGIAAADLCSLEIGGFVIPVTDTSDQI